MERASELAADRLELRPDGEAEHDQDERQHQADRAVDDQRESNRPNPARPNDFGAWPEHLDRHHVALDQDWLARVLGPGFRVQRAPCGEGFVALFGLHTTWYPEPRPRNPEPGEALPGV